MIMETIDRFAARFAIPLALIIAVGGIALALQAQEGTRSEAGRLVPEDMMLPIVWGDLGQKLVSAGVIDDEKMRALYGEWSEEHEQLLSGVATGQLVMSKENADYLLNLLWAFGLANSNPILADETEMMNPEYGGAGGFASTGGWTLAKGDAMEHYNAHPLVPLTAEEQSLVEKVSRGIYRPCCDNSTHFPDCNHGMAMLGLLELVAAGGGTEEEMWRAALAANAFWFPDTYETIALYEQKRGVAWEDVDPRLVLGKEYSSASGFSRIAAAVGPRTGRGASCGI
jgi:hypothetical protein